ncbi:endonuclease MutS2 [bacterium]|nr:endonuclease MutS2 [bacterium]
MFELNLLDYPKILKKVSDYAYLEETKKNILSLKPSRNKDFILSRLHEVYEIKNIIYRLSSIDYIPFDLTITIDRLRIKAVLNQSEFMEINKLIYDVNRTYNYFNLAPNVSLDTGNISKYLDKLINLKSVKDLMDQVFDFEGNIMDNASSELYRIRKSIRTYEAECINKLNEIIRKDQDKLSEAIITIRQGHRVIPVLAQYRSKIKGIVFDESASGQTIYVEPYQISEIENKITVLKNNEKQEIEKILFELSNNVSDYYESIKTDLDLIYIFDDLFARGEYAKEISGEKVEISSYIDLIDARHPLIAKEKVVPNTITLRDRNTMIITGPNTGGKTVVLKTLGLLSLMVQSGLLIPVKEGSKTIIFDGIYADIGDEQSIEQSLSTFSSHMSRIVKILKKVKPNSLVLLDELGSGTDPKEGASLAISILDHLRSLNLYTVSTTHYPELKLYAYQNEDIENASVEFDVNTLKPTYKLIIGISGGSNAFLISSRLGLNPEIIKNAKNKSLEFKDKESFLIKKLEKDSIRARRLKEEYLRLKTDFEIEKENHRVMMKEEKEKINLKYDEISLEKSKILEKTQKDATLLLDEIKSIKKDILNKEEVKDNKIAELRGITNNLYDAPLKRKKNNTDEISVGDNVKCLTYDKIGKVIKIEKNKYIVQLGSMVSSFKKNEIEYIEIYDPVKAIIDKNTPHKSTLKLDVSSRLDLRGMRYEEAEEALIKFIDDAIYANLNEVEIVHGFGTLALRNMVINYCKSNKEIKRFRSGEEHEGGRGVTICYFKE